MEICAVRIMEDRSRLGVMYLEDVLIKLITLSISRTRLSDMETYRPSTSVPRTCALIKGSTSPFSIAISNTSRTLVHEFLFPPTLLLREFLFIYFGFPLNRGCGYAPGVGISCNTCLPSFWSYDSMGTLGYP